MNLHRLAPAALFVCLQAAGICVALADGPAATGTMIADSRTDRAMPAQPETDLAAVSTLWAQLWDAKQLDAVVGLYEEGAAFLTPDGGRYAGRAAIRAMFGKALASHSTRLRLHSLANGSQAGLGYDSGDYQDTVTESGSTRNVRGYYLLVLRRQPEGQWLIVQQVLSEASASGSATMQYPQPPLPLPAPAAAPIPPPLPAAESAAPPLAPLAPAAPTAPPAASEPDASAADVNIVSAPPPAPPPRPYDKTGCDRGLFKGPPPGKWLDTKSWERLHAGMSMPEVEELLGVEHYDESKKGKLQWEYGRCGHTFEGVVVFDQGRMTGWNPPDR